MGKRTQTRFSARMIQGARASEMPGFVAPQLAASRSRAPSGDQWLHEIKYDGYRVQLHVDKQRRIIFTRTGLDWTRRFSVIAGAFDIPVERAILDGEIVVIKDGRTSFGITVTVHSIPEGRSWPFLRTGRFWPAPAWLEDTTGLSLDAREKAVMSEWPANALGGAQRVEQIGLRFAREQIGEAREAIPDGFQSGHAIVLAAQMCAGARPAPILCRTDHITVTVHSIPDGCRSFDSDGFGPRPPRQLSALSP